MQTAFSPIPRAAALALIVCASVTLDLSKPALAQEAAQPVVQTEAPVITSLAPDAASIQPNAAVAAPKPPAETQRTTSEVAAPATAIEPGLAQTDFSAWGMYKAAHWVVKAVMVMLGFACFVTWTILIFKFGELALARRWAKHSVRVIQKAETLEAASSALSSQHDPAAFMAQAALVEYQRSLAAISAAGSEGVKERTRSVLDRVEVQAGSRIRRGTGVLATIGATAPFVGLFGTVWGIMNSFIGIAESQTTNLAVVAPGIAEALLATAIGLVAAIPAVVIYNHFSREIAHYRQILGDAAAGVERLLSRDLDFRRAEQAGA